MSEILRNKKGFAGEWVPLFVSLVFILLFGFFVPKIFVALAPGYTPEIRPILQPLYSFTTDGVDLFLFQFNPFEWLGEDINSFFTDSIGNLNYYPDWFLYPFLLLSILGILYTLIKSLPTT